MPAEDRSGPVELGAYVADDPTAATWESFNLTIGRKVDYQLHYPLWTGDLIPAGLEGQLEDLDAAPILGWRPVAEAQSALFDGTLGDVATGVLDTYLKACAAEAKAYGDPLIVRLAHEFNGTWYSYGFEDETPAEFVAGWKYVVDLFAGEGVTNVLWCWNPTTWSPEETTGSVTDPTEFWPGDGYVDVIGIDGYSELEGQPSPTQIFQDNYEALCELGDQRMIICEVGAAAVEGFDKAAWFALLGEWLEAAPRVWAACYWNADRGEDGGDDTIDSSGTDVPAREAFISLVNAAPFASGGSAGTLLARLAALPILDTLKRSENPLAGKWSGTWFSDNPGKATATGWVTTTSSQWAAAVRSEILSAPAATAATVAVLPTTTGHEIGLSLFATTAADKAESGIQARLERKSDGTYFAYLGYYVNGTFHELANKTIPLAAADRLALSFDPSEPNGLKLIRTAAGAVQVVLSLPTAEAPLAELGDFAGPLGKGSADTSYRIVDFAAGELVEPEPTRPRPGSLSLLGVGR